MTREHSDKSHQHDTPRTDALLLETHEGRVYEHHGSMVEHARQLERELLSAYEDRTVTRANTSTRRTTNPADILIYWCQQCGNENTVRLEAPQSPKALAPSARLTSQSYTAQDLQGWIDLLEMFSESHSMLQGAAGEDAMNVGDVLRFIYDLKWRMEATQSSTLPQEHCQLLRDLRLRLVYSRDEANYSGLIGRLQTAIGQCEGRYELPSSTALAGEVAELIKKIDDSVAYADQHTMLEVHDPDGTRLWMTAKEWRLLKLTLSPHRSATCTHKYANNKDGEPGICIHCGHDYWDGLREQTPQLRSHQSTKE